MEGLQGDWAIYGQPQYEEWQQTVKRLGLSEVRALDCIRVARLVRFPCRHGNLSFSHHELVARRDQSDGRTVRFTNDTRRRGQCAG